MKLNKLRQNRGFTLVELMIVIAIIGILAVLGITSFTNAARRGRDATRKSDLANLRQALVLYRSDNGRYPANLNALAAGARYIREVPLPPTHPHEAYIYRLMGANNREFILCARLEMPSGNRNGNPGERDCNPNVAMPTPNANGDGFCHCVVNP